MWGRGACSRPLKPRSRTELSSRIRVVGTKIGVAEEFYLRVARIGKQVLVSDRPGGICELISPSGIFHVPGLGSRFIFEVRASQVANYKY